MITNEDINYHGYLSHYVSEIVELRKNGVGQTKIATLLHDRGVVSGNIATELKFGNSKEVDKRRNIDALVGMISVIFNRTGLTARPTPIRKLIWEKRLRNRPLDLDYAEQRDCWHAWTVQDQYYEFNRR